MLSRVAASSLCAVLFLIGCESSRGSALVITGDASVALDASEPPELRHVLTSRDEQTGDCMRDGSCEGRGGYHCSDYVRCLESDPSSAAVCEFECDDDPRVCSSSGLRRCIRGGGGLACFRRECGFGPDPAELCPRRAACVRGGGGYACFRRSC